MKRPQGFTLIELLIVLAVILIIAAIAIPSIVHMKINANETSAAASLKAIQTAQVSYQTTYPYRGYADSLAVLGGADPCTPAAVTACLLDETQTSGEKAGYSFAVTAANPVSGANTTYVAGAAPAAYNHTGVRRFCTTEKNVLRADENAEGSTTPPTAEECAHFKAMR